MMFWEYMLRGLCVGGWVIGFIVAVGGYVLLAYGLIKAAVYIAGGEKEDGPID